jgi:hypothetical protein
MKTTIEIKYQKKITFIILVHRISHYKNIFLYKFCNKKSLKIMFLYVF